VTLRRRARALFGALLLTGVTLCAPCASSGELIALPPHTAVYRVLFKGIGAGDFELQLRRGTAADSYRYETIPHPSLLARLIVSADSREISEFRVTEAGVVPQSYHLDDGGSHKDDMELRYDWSTGRVHGRAGAKPVDLAIGAGTQDVMSIRAAILHDLAAGKTATEYAMIDQDEVKTYVYRKTGSESVATPQGSYDTVVWESRRKGSDNRDKTWKYWYAPALGYLPVRADQLEDGKTRLSFQLRSAHLD